MPSLAETVERTTRHFALFRVYGYEFDLCSADEVIQVTQSLGAVSGLNHDRDLDERGDRHQARISGLYRFDEEAPFGFALQDGHEGRGVDDHSTWETVLVIAENLVCGPGVEDRQIRAVLR